MLNAQQFNEIVLLLRAANLRPTRQRIHLGMALFGNGHRHVTAEMLYEEAINNQMTISLATVYNTLRRFTDAGLLRTITVDGSKTYFDTNTAAHHHFFVENENTLLDVPDGEHAWGMPLTVPVNYAVTRVDVVVRLRRKAAS